MPFVEQHMNELNTNIFNSVIVRLLQETTLPSGVYIYYEAFQTQEVVLLFRVRNSGNVHLELRK